MCTMLAVLAGACKDDGANDPGSRGGAGGAAAATSTGGSVGGQGGDLGGGGRGGGGQPEEGGARGGSVGSSVGGSVAGAGGHGESPAEAGHGGARGADAPGGAGAGPATATVEKMIGPEGGLLQDSQGAAVNIPASAVSSTMMVGVTELGSYARAKGTTADLMPLPQATASAGGVVAFTPHGASFLQPVSVVVPFDPAMAARATADHPLKLFTAEPGGAWAPVANAQLAGGLATAHVTHFSYFVVGFESAGQPVTGLAPHKLDLLFMVDSSASMTPLQTQLTGNLPDFMNTLKALPGGLPDLHLAVISSDLGAASYVVPGCKLDGDQGAFLHAGHNPAGCAAPSDPFIVSSGDTKNYTGDITDAFSCIALLGQNGCGFESQLGSVVAALDPTGINAGSGFLRDDALLGIVLLTNEDDCSTSRDSTLFDPNMTDPAKDPYGALQSYRCTEFGIVCDSGPVPHLGPATPVTLTGCHSREDGLLTRVSELVTRIKQFKADPNHIFVASIMAPSSDTVTISATTVGAAAAPVLNHVPGCESYSADNPIRLASFVSAFGQHGLAKNICQDSYADALAQIGSALGQSGALCVPVAALGANSATSTTPALAAGCMLLETVSGATSIEIPACAAGNTGVAAPCYALQPDASCSTDASSSGPSGSGQAFAISRPSAPPAGATLSVFCP